MRADLIEKLNRHSCECDSYHGFTCLKCEILASFTAPEPEPVAWQRRSVHGEWTDDVWVGKSPPPTWDARALVVASPAPEPRAGVGVTEGWRDIKTAPKDGRQILLRVDDGDDFIAIQGWFERAPADMCWYDVRHEPVEPTHWMSLAASPLPNGDSEGQADA